MNSHPSDFRFGFKKKKPPSFCVSSTAWPRYRVLRALDIGQYNLEISNAELSDDSLFECQATEAALRSRRAKLNVLGESAVSFSFVSHFVSAWRSCLLLTSSTAS